MERNYINSSHRIYSKKLNFRGIYINMEKIITSLIPADTSKEEYLSASASIRFFNTHVRKEDIPEEYSQLITVIKNYFRETNGGLLDKDIFEVLVAKAPIEDNEKLALLNQFSKFSRESVPFSKAKFLIKQYNERKEAAWISEQQALSMLALEKGWTDPKTKIRLTGAEGAKIILQEILYKNPYSKLDDSNPGGDIRQDGEEVLQEYEDAKQGVQGSDVIQTGLREIDIPTGGFKKGEFILIGAFTGQGKSILAANIAYHNCLHGKNGIIFTAETSRKVYRRRVYTRHSCNPCLGKTVGLDSNKIRDGVLAKDEEALFLKLVDDFSNNPEYGYLDIQQVTQGATVPSIITKAEEINRRVPIDFIILDYLELLSPSRKRGSRREELEEMLKESKEAALTFNNGQGVVFIDLHQMKQEAAERVKPEDDKFYTIADFGNTSEAGKSADIAIGLLFNDECRQAHEVAAKLLKVRDGAPTPMFKLYEKFASSYLDNLG